MQNWVAFYVCGVGATFILLLVNWIASQQADHESKAAVAMALLAALGILCWCGSGLATTENWQEIWISLSVPCFGMIWPLSIYRLLSSGPRRSKT